MFRALLTATDRRHIDLSMLPKSPLLGVFAALSLLAATALVPVAAQEPVPEPVVEDALPDVESGQPSESVVES